MAIYALKMQDLVEKNDQNLSYFYWSLHCIALHWSCLIFLYWWMLWHHNLIGFASQYHLHFYFLKTWYFTVKALKYSQNLVLSVLYLRPSLENLQIFQTLRQICIWDLPTLFLYTLDVLGRILTHARSAEAWESQGRRLSWDYYWCCMCCIYLPWMYNLKNACTDPDRKIHLNLTSEPE